jgi:hypothetical protein
MKIPKEIQIPVTVFGIELAMLSALALIFFVLVPR